MNIVADMNLRKSVHPRVTVRFNSPVTSINVEKGSVGVVRSGDEVFPADQIVFCTGNSICLCTSVATISYFIKLHLQHLSNLTVGFVLLLAT